MPLHLERLEGVHPDLANKVKIILEVMDRIKAPMFVVEGVRTRERQMELYAKGRFGHPGKIVTNADGIAKLSNHQVKPDGYGHAVDCAFQDDPATDRIETYDPKQPWRVYGELGEWFGLTWGGRWKSPFDQPHLELR